MNPWFEFESKRYEGRVIDGRTIIACPKCGDGIVFHRELNPNPDEMWLPHELSLQADGAMTVNPSVVCPRQCGWHVVITNGTAVSA